MAKYFALSTLYDVILYSIVSYYVDYILFVLHCTMLYYIILYYIILYSTIPYLCGSAADARFPEFPGGGAPRGASAEPGRSGGEA